MFKKVLGCPSKVSELLSEISTFKKCLPQGSSSSTMIANLVILNLGRRLDKLATDNGGKFSIFVDDITISGPLHLESLISLVKEIISEEKFTYHKEKTRGITNSEEIVVTGVRIDKGLDAPSGVFKDMQNSLNCMKKQISTGQVISKKELASMAGRLAWLNGLNSGQAKILSKEYRNLFN